MKVFDVFPFFNELDLLEIRLNILDPYVDFFIISESTKTFQGNFKPLFYGENKSRFEKFNHKIIHNIVDDTNGPEIHPYDRDVFQKDKIKEVILNHCSDADVIVWGDLDEIPNPEVFSEIKQFFEDDTIFHFAQENCIGYLNLVEITGTIQSMTPDFDYENGKKMWLGTKLFGKSILEKYTLSQLRSKQDSEKNARIFPGGWHWSYVGSEGLSIEERILKKLECAAHAESNINEIRNNVSRIRDNKDPLGRDYASYKTISLNDSYPSYIIENKEKYSYLIKDYENMNFKKINLSNVTLFCISSNNVEGALFALQHSMKGIEFGAVKLITHEKPSNLPEGIEFSKCPEIKSIHEYNHYCIYNLTNHIDTEYCLLVQPDGFVVNPDKWDDEFFNYDYIGAPWEEVSHSYLDPWGKSHRVGNGGFSFRSKKLLDVPKRAYIHFDVNWGDFYKHFGYGNTAEDGNICVHNRHIYEALGCKFAPVEVAAKFSHEKQLPETEGITPFGFHYHLPEGTVL